MISLTPETNFNNPHQDLQNSLLGKSIAAIVQHYNRAPENPLLLAQNVGKSRIDTVFDEEFGEQYRGVAAVLDTKNHKLYYRVNALDENNNPVKINKVMYISTSASNPIPPGKYIFYVPDSVYQFALQNPDKSYFESLEAWGDPSHAVLDPTFFVAEGKDPVKEMKENHGFLRAVHSIIVPNDPNLSPKTIETEEKRQLGKKITSGCIRSQLEGNREFRNTVIKAKEGGLSTQMFVF